MTRFAHQPLPDDPSVIAPDGAQVRLLLTLPAGGMAHFALRAGEVSTAVTHRTVEEIWYVVSGRGEMWRLQDGHEEVIALSPGVCLTLPLGTHFQFRACDTEGVAAVAITMPPWPGPDEAVVVPGPWQPTGPTT
jgi:mannose-6-phosphate isomerase-like protein (cupin superfamily)